LYSRATGKQPLNKDTIKMFTQLNDLQYKLKKVWEQEEKLQGEIRECQNKLAYDILPFKVGDIIERDSTYDLVVFTRAVYSTKELSQLFGCKLKKDGTPSRKEIYIGYSDTWNRCISFGSKG
jgi:hypothetical protein